MKIPQANKVYVLNPYYHLRHDIYRTVLFSAGMGSAADCSLRWHTFIHPLQAAMLSFFTYNRPWGKTLPLLCGFFRRSPEEVTRWVSQFIGNPGPVCTSSPQGKICFPKRLLMEAEEADGALRFDRLKPDDFTCRETDLTTRRLYGGPLLLTFMLTNRCVTRCKYCYADTSTPVKSPLPTARIMELIEEAERIKVQQINLIGGEIFLHPDWKAILKALVEKDMSPEFISTKIPVTLQTVEDIKETGYRGIVQISLDTCNPLLLSESLQAPPHYAGDMLRALHLLDAGGLNYHVSSVLTNYNCDTGTLTELLHRLSELKHLRDWRILPVNNSASRDYKEFARLKPEKTKIAQVFRELRPLISRSPFPVILGEDALKKKYYETWGGSRYFKGSECSALNTHMFILPDGKVTICEQLYWHPKFIIGDVTGQSLKEVWNSPEALHLCSPARADIGEASACKRCRFFEDCYGYRNRCWSDVVKAYGAEHWDFPDPRCREAGKMVCEL